MLRKVANRLGLEITRTPRPKTSWVKEIIQKTGRHLGFHIRYAREEEQVRREYEPITTYASYSPWNSDENFITLYDKIKDHTLVDIYRCYEIWSLVGQVSKLDQGSIIEVGTWKGGTGAILAKAATHFGIRENVYLCDTFEGVVKATDEDSVYTGGEHSDTSRELVESFLSDTVGVQNVTILQGIFPEETSEPIENRKFRLCHVDVDVYQSSKDVVDWVWERLVVHGIVVYDDYGYHECDGITKHVNEQMGMDDRLVFYNLNGHAVIVKLK